MIAKSLKTPPLEDLMPPELDEAPAGPQSPEEMWSIAQRWNAAVNGRVERLDG